ncbi:MAG TPA: DUF4386 domain-containing protein [Terriglobales bacterium]|nr:DUF4386 domain-containing protein [Terriglobales bacterium]
MTSLSKNARIAGLLYLTLLGAPLRLIYIPNRLFVTGNPSATASNIAAHEMLFRCGILADLFTGVMSLFLMLALYRLLKGVNEGLAVVMVILGSLMSTPIYFVNTLNDAAALLCARGTNFLSVFDSLSATRSSCFSSVCMARACWLTRSFGACGCFRSACWYIGRAFFPAYWASG